MEPRDKYTVFSKWDRGYRKGIHKMPKFTRVCPLLLITDPVADTRFVQVTQRVNPKGF